MCQDRLEYARLINILKFLKVLKQYWVISLLCFMSVSGHCPYLRTEADRYSTICNAAGYHSKWKQDVNQTSPPKSICLDVTHMALIHFSLAKATCMIMANFKKRGNAILPCI